LLANAAYFAWTQGYLAPLGLAPVEQSEPQRLQSQIRPEALRLLNRALGRRVTHALKVLKSGGDAYLEG
jgi:hypothetical protein